MPIVRKIHPAPVEPPPAEPPPAEQPSPAPAPAASQADLAAPRRPRGRPRRDAPAPRAAAADSAGAPEQGDGDLPPGWEWIKLGEISWVTKLAGFEFTKFFKYQDEGEVRVVRGLNVGFGVFKEGEFKYISESISASLPRSQLQGGEILIAYVGTLGTVTILPNDGFRYHLGPNVAKVVIDVDESMSKYIMYYLLSAKGQQMIFGTSKAVAQSSLSMAQIRSFVLPLAPLAEQRRIVEAIEELLTRLDAGVAGLRAAQARLKRYRASVLKAACEGRLVPQDPSDEPAEVLLARILKGRAQRVESKNKAQQVNFLEEEAVKVIEQPELPQGWVWTSIGALFRVTIGGTPSRQVSEYWENGYIPWISSGEVAFCRINDTREKITLEGLHNSNAKLNPPGTVLLAMIGEGKTRGQAAIIDIEAANNQNIASIFCSETEVLPEWVFYWLQSSYEQTRKTSSGGMQYALNTQRVKNIHFPLPPLAEQRRIVAEVERRLSVAGALEAALAANLRRAERLRQAILRRAFAGRLVPQDPADEPAAALLARIRGGRGAGAGDAGGRGQAAGGRAEQQQMDLAEL